MILGRLTPVNVLEIWNPKWSTRTVKLAAHKIGTHNVITFPKAKSLEGEWYISGDNVRKYPKSFLKTKSGTNMDIYEVPLGDLEPFERGE